MTEEARQHERMLRETEPEDCIDFPYKACTMIHAAADLIESLSTQLEQVTRERDVLLDELKGECDVCANRKDCTAFKCRKSQHKECEECPCHTCIYDTNWEWEGMEANQ